MSRWREEPGQVQLRWPGRSWLVRCGRRVEKQEEEEEPGSARSGAGTDPAPLRVGEPPPPLLGSDTQRGRKEESREGSIVRKIKVWILDCKDERRVRQLFV